MMHVDMRLHQRYQSPRRFPFPALTHTHLDHGGAVARARPVLHSGQAVSAYIDAARVLIAHVHERAGRVGEVEGFQPVLLP